MRLHSRLFLFILMSTGLSAFAATDSLICLNAKFIQINPGSFMMGSPSTELYHNSDEALRFVTISKGFELQATLVTQQQYFLVTGTNPSYFHDREVCPYDYIEINGVALCPNHPVEHVSWTDAQNFIALLSKNDAEYSYRLPTEAEWEYSLRAGTQTAYWFGDHVEVANEFAWSKENADNKTHAVGLKPANPWGLFDAVGNVSQLVADRYEENWDTKDQIDPQGPATGLNRVTRGCGWDGYAQGLRSAGRFAIDPNFGFNNIGFRLVRIRK